MKSKSLEGDQTVRLVCLGDTHERHWEVRVPDGDILIHVGDFTNMSKSLEAIEDFDDWLGELPHPHKIVVPGNHEFFLEADSSRRFLLGNARVLINEGVEFCGLRFWGSPTTPLYGGAFGVSSARDRRRLWSTIPNGLDVLITHGPPLGILDTLSGNNEHLGDPELYIAVVAAQPAVHVFGHVHSGYGQVEKDSVIFVNASVMNLQGQIAEVPHTFSLAEPPISK